MKVRRISLDGVPRSQWLAMRVPNINASEVPTVLGEAHYGSAAELFAEKKGLRPPREDTAILRKGRWGEAAGFEALADECPQWEIRRAKIYVVDDDLRMGCTPDGAAIAPDRQGIGIVQVKVVAAHIFRQRWLDDDSNNLAFGDATPPVPFVLQTLTEMMLTNAEWGVIAVLIVPEYDWHFRLFPVERNAVREQLIIDGVQKFFREHLDPGVMPAFEPQRDQRLIRELYPQDTGEVISLDTDNRALTVIEELAEVSAACKRLESREDELRTELMGKLGDATYAKCGDRWLSWRATNFKAYSVPAQTRRVFRVHTTKPKGLKDENQ